MNIIKMCQVFLLEDRSILVEGVDYEPTGPGGLVSKIRVRLSPEACNGLLGVIVLGVLDQTSEINSALWDEKDVLVGRLSLSNVKSNKIFMAQSKCLCVSIEGGHVVIIPTSYEPNSGGWYKHLIDRKAECAGVAEQVRELLVTKFDECS